MTASWKVLKVYRVEVGMYEGKSEVYYVRATSKAQAERSVMKAYVSSGVASQREVMVDWDEQVMAYHIFREFVNVKAMLKVVDKFHLLNKNFMRPHKQYRHINSILKKHGIEIDYWYTMRKWFDIYDNQGVITFQFFRGIPNQIRSIKHLDIDIVKPLSDEKLKELLTRAGFKQWPA